MTSFLEQQRAIFEAIKHTETVPELLHKTDLEFIVSSFDDILLPLIVDNDVVIIAGAYFGDEAKGKTTDAIAHHPLIDLVVRYNSGENAGHTVYLDGKKYVFHLTPSGILIPDKQCAIGPECVMDPINFMAKEIGQLTANGVEYKDKLTVGNVHVVGPYHKILDFVVNPRNSSTLKGMSPAHASKVWKKGLRLDDIFNSEDAQAKTLTKDMRLYNAFLKEMNLEEQAIIDDFRAKVEKGTKIPQHIFDFLEAKDKVAFLIDAYRTAVRDNDEFPTRGDVTHLSNEVLERGGKIAVECPQSYWLSNATEKHWGSSTSAQTHAAGVIASSLINISKYKFVTINVAKTPGDSRVGLGANPSSFVNQTYFSDRDKSSLDELGDMGIDFDAIQKQYFDSVLPNGILEPTVWTDTTGEYSISEAIATATSRECGEFGATTGKPRITGVFDCLAAKQVNDAQGPYLSLSALDRGDKMDKVGITVAYVYHNTSEEEIVDSNGIKYKNGDIIRIGDPYPTDKVLYHCHPIMKVMDSWKDTPIAADVRDPNDDLPQTLQNVMGTIEDLTGMEIVSIGNGKHTENMIYVDRLV